MNRTDDNRRDYSVSMLAANFYSLLTAGPILVLMALLYAWVWGLEKPLAQVAAALDQMYSSMTNVLVYVLVFLVIFSLGVVVHEFIHGLAWKLAGKRDWKAIQFGFQWSTLTPYAHVREPLPVEAYRLGTLMPCLITGVLPALVGLLAGHVGLLLLGLLFILAAGGDLTILVLIRKVPGGSLVEDHPTRAGCRVLENTTK
jgi:hypothetical protein